MQGAILRRKMKNWSQKKKRVPFPFVLRNSSLIRNSVGGAGADPPTSKKGTFFHMRPKGNSSLSGGERNFFLDAVYILFKIQFLQRMRILIHDIVD